MRISNSIRWLSIALVMLAMCSAASAGVFLSVNFGPPPLPVYAQPLCPGPGYIWTPGYWAYGPDGYFWVPGTWVVAPQPGLLWTPGYWGWSAGLYYWHAGYWGPTVGFYGGVPYGYGYTGVGYHGGYWRGRDFYYNRTVNNVNVVNVHNTYNTTIINNNTTVNRVSYNGGPGGIAARPTRAEEVAARQHHFAPTAAQERHVNMAKSNPDLRASVNHGKPAIAATARAAEFKRGAVAASRAGAPSRAPETRASEAHANSVPRPGSASRPGNVARAENPRTEGAMHNSVPRPPSTYHETSAARNQNVAPRANVPRPSSENRPTGEARTENAPRPNVNHAQNVPHPQEASRQPSHYNAPRPQNQPRPQAQHQAQPRPEAHPQAEPRGEKPQR